MEIIRPPISHTDAHSHPQNVGVKCFSTHSTLRKEGTLMGGLEKKSFQTPRGRFESQCTGKTTERKQMDSGLQKLTFPVPSLWLMLLDHLPQGTSLSQLGQGVPLLHRQAGAGWGQGCENKQRWLTSHELEWLSFIKLASSFHCWEQLRPKGTKSTFRLRSKRNRNWEVQTTLGQRQKKCLKITRAPGWLTKGRKKRAALGDLDRNKMRTFNKAVLSGTESGSVPIAGR